jgi:hypothetical protein
MWKSWSMGVGALSLPTRLESAELLPEAIAAMVGAGASASAPDFVSGFERTLLIRIGRAAALVACPSVAVTFFPSTVAAGVSVAGATAGVVLDEASEGAAAGAALGATCGTLAAVVTGCVAT